MKTRFFLITITTMVIATFISSCSKQNVQGPQGPQGTAGSNGVNGANGVANISSKLITIYPSDWSTIGGGEFEYGYADSALTNADIDGVEIFYQEEVYPNAYEPLPCTNFLANGDKLSYIYGTITIDFYYFYSSAPIYPLVIKIVVIPPSIMLQNPNTNWKDYNQINALIHLQKPN